MFKPKALTIAIVSSALFLTACNSNDDDNIALPSKAAPVATMTTITVTPSLGKILNGRISLKNAKTGAVLAPTQTITPANNGTATFTVPVAKLAEPVLAELLPTTAGIVEYFDEALEANKTITVPAVDIAKPILRAAATVAANANIGVTALTEAAVQQAAKQTGGLTVAQNINTANAAVKNALNLNFDVTQAPAVIGYGDFYKLIDAALTAQRKAYAMYLATLAKEAQRINTTSTTPAYDMAKAFADDFSFDGTFNAVGSQALAINYTNAFLTNWFNWVANFYTSFANLNSLVALNRWYSGFNVASANSVNTFTDATPLRTVDGVEEYACSGEGRIKSSSGASIYMDFVNQRGSNMNVYWLNYNTGRVSYKQNLATGQTHNQQTFVTHPWLITDNTGACIGIYKPVTATNKTLTFKPTEVMIGNQVTQPTTCTTGVETTFATSVGNAPYTNGQKVCFDASATTLAFNSKTLTNPVKNTAVSSPYSAYAFKDGSYSYEVIFNNNALYEINLSLTSFLGQFTPTATTTPTTETCASKNLPVATLSSIADYNGDYKEAGTVVFTLNTATAKASVKGTEANITEVCGPTVINSGTNHVLITDKGNVTLFKTTAGVQSAEGYEFVNKNNTFYGEKAGAALTNLAASGTATGTISNVQYNKDGTTTGGTGQVRSKVYTFSGDLNGTYTIKIKDTAQNLRYDVNGTNGKPSSVNLYASESSASPLFVYTCDDSSCLSKVNITQSSTGTTVKFTDMKMRGIYQAQYDAIINGQSVLTATLCESTGSDNTLGFKNAPSDFCSFSQNSVVTITNPDTYTFFNADKKENVKIIMNNGSLVSVALENNNYAWSCGVGANPACTGITVNTANNNTTFTFNNAVLTVDNGATQALTVSGALIYQAPATGSVTLNTAACTANTAAAGVNCAASLMADTTINLRQAGNNAACTFTKSGQTLTLGVGATTITSTLNGDANDAFVDYGSTKVVSAVVLTNNSATSTISLNISNGAVVQATGTGPAGSLVCAAL